MIILIQKLYAGGLPTKRKKMGNRYIDIENYSNAYKVRLQGQRAHNFLKTLKGENI